MVSNCQCGIQGKDRYGEINFKINQILSTLFQVVWDQLNCPIWHHVTLQLNSQALDKSSLTVVKYDSGMAVLKKTALKTHSISFYITICYLTFVT